MVGLKNMVMVQLVLMAAALCLISSTSAASFTVGDDEGWMQPTSASFYADWAAKYTFAVGDELDFKWTGSHTVAEVTKDAYDNCDTSNTLSLHQTSPVTIKLNSTGDTYYICTVSGHCGSGQKLAISVGGSSSSSPSPDGTPTGSGSDGSSGSRGATSLNVGMFVTLLFVVVGLLGS